MARVVGIDLRSTHVRAVLLRTSYRRVTVERVLEVEVRDPGGLEQALLACALPLTQHAEAVAVAVEGEQSFLHRIRLPTTALKQLDEVVPFELEAQVPVDIDDLVYDFRTLKRASSSDPVVVMAAAARIEHVRERIELVERVLGRPVERVGVGPLTMANLAPLVPELSGPGPVVALVDLGGARSEVLILHNGEPMFARTLSRGVAGLPGTAPALAADLRQTLAAWASQGGGVVETLYLVGGGAAAPGAEAYLAHELGSTVKQLPAPTLDGLTPEVAAVLPRFAKAISIAMGLSGRARDLDLRRGELSVQRGYGFLKEKIPVLAGLAVAILVSFVFATWAELRALDREQEVLAKALSSLSKEVLGQETTDPGEAKTLLDKAEGKDEVDPIPKLDAFDVIVEISKAVPDKVTHDIEELEVQRGHVKVNGIVSSAADSQAIAANLKNVRCFSDVKVSKLTQVINSDRQKYVMEFDIKCPEEAQKKKKKPEEGSEPAPEGTP
jgi:general secretion pathway protein L